MSVEERLEHLEQKVQWMWRLGAVGVALVAGILLLGQGKDKELPDLEVRSLTVVDKGGKTRAGLLVNADGSPGLDLYDKNGKLRAGLFVAPDGSPGLNLYDKNGKPHIGLATLPDGTASLSLYKDGQTRAALGMRGANGNMHLSFWDRNRKSRTALTMVADGSSHLVLRDKNETARVELATRVDGSPRLRLFNVKGRVNLAAGDQDLEVASLVLKDKNGMPRAKLGTWEKDGSPYLGLLDSRGANCINLHVGADGSPSLALSKKGGGSVFMLSTADDGVTGLTVRDKDGKPRVNLSSAGLVLKDKDADARFIVSTQPDGSPYLGLVGKGGKVGLFVSDKTGELGLGIVGKDDKQCRVKLGALPDGGYALTFLDADGKVIWQAPKE